MGKKYILICFILFTSFFNEGYSQKWIVKDSILVFPQGFSSWLKRNNGGIDSAAPGNGNQTGASGNIGTNQGVDVYDFNKDGLPDLTFQLYPSNNITREYLKGIFIQNTNGKFVLDTNYVIKAKGDMWYGGFADFNGDGLNDYYYIIQNYHGADSNRKYSPEMVNDHWPERVFINNGKSFDTLSLDINNLRIMSIYAADIDKDGSDEIISTGRETENFITIYKYDKYSKSFFKFKSSVTNKWGTNYQSDRFSYPLFNIGNFNNAEKFATLWRSGYTPGMGQYYNTKFTLSIFDLKNESFLKDIDVERSPKFISKNVFGVDADDNYKFNVHEIESNYFLDIDKDGIDELIVSGYYMNDWQSSINPAPQRFAYGYKVFNSAGKDVTDIYFSNSGFDKNVEIISQFLDIDENIPGIELIPGTWGGDGGGNSIGTVGYYYKLVNRKFEKYFIRDLKHESGKKIDSTYFKEMQIVKYPKFTKNKNALLMYDFNNIKRTSIIYQVSCADAVKPTFNTNKFYFVTGDSLKLTISNANKGDTLKWYYGTKSDLSNVTNKTFTDSTKLYVTRTDSIGCLISSDTVKITAYPKLQTAIKLKITNFNLTNKIPNNLTNPKTLGNRLMEGGITSLIKYNIKNEEHLVVIPSDTIPGPQLHFIKKQNEWEFENYYTSFKMDGARSYSIMDTIGNFVYSSHGNESVHPWPLGDIVVVNTISDTLRWKKISTLKGHYDNCSSGDLNNDGLIDVITMNMGLKLDTLITKNPWYGVSCMFPYTQNSDGTFTENHDLISDPVLDGKWPGNHSTGAVLIAKILGNSRPEIILADYGMNPSYPSDRYSFAIFKFNESISKYQFFKTTASLGAFSNYNQGATSMKAGDFNNDGKTDIAIASEGALDNGKPGGIVQIWLNNDNGNFIPSQSIICDADSAGFREFEVADINKDGWLDIVLNGGGGVAYRGSSPYPNGFYINLEPSIWLNIYGTLVPFQGNLQINRSLNSANIAPQISPVKPFFINEKLTFVGFQSNCTLNGCNVDTTNSFNLYEATVTFCNNLIKPTFNTSKYSFCSSDSLKLSVSNINKGDSLKWYYGAKSDITNVSNKTFTDSTKLFVTRTDSLGCVISSDTISITKNALPALPSVKDTVFCQNINASTLLATGTSGNTITWYGTNAAGGTGNASAVVASTTDTTTKSYYVSQINNTTSCESPRAKITVKINPAPASPSVKDTAYCNNISADTLRATSLAGHTLNWYGTSATGGTGSVLGSKPITTTVGSFNYYVSQKNNSTGCEGARAKIGVIINPLPIAPVVRDTNYCNNASADTIRLNTSTGATLLWYGTSATGGTSSTIAIKPSTATVGAANYYLSQIITATGCEGPRSKVVVTTKAIPSAPTLSRDTANFLLSGAPGTTWYKDGSAITDTTQKYKPATPGSYTAKTTTNGCTSVMSAAYYYLVTDIINLSKDEFIKLAPNPFINQLNFDFVVKGYQKLNIEVYDVATGSKVATQQNITAGTQIQLGQLARGTYIIRITSNDNKIAHQFKMVKL